jgi:excinuclease ABC subunit A
MLYQETQEEISENKIPEQDGIYIKGARSNNLKNVDLFIPRNSLTVVTGVSGSGKSTITMDTLYAEGQRRYVESLSSYARQFLMRMKKPDVDFIKGVCPAIAIEQKVSSGNARSTVGSMTELYEFLRLLYARIGKTFSPVSGELVRRHTVSDVVDFVLSQQDGSKVLLSIPMPSKYKDRTLDQELNLLLQKGYSRVLWQGQQIQIDEALASGDFDVRIPAYLFREKDLQVLIDRFVVVAGDAENTKRIADSVQTAFEESEGECIIAVLEGETKAFNNRFEADGILFIDPVPQLFNYNNPFGACPSCEGYGKVLGIDEDKVFPDKMLSVYDGAIACWRGEKSSDWQEPLVRNAHHFDFPVHRSYQDLTKEEKKLLWQGNQYFEGLNAFFHELESKTYKIQNRIMLARYRGKTTCPVCDGGRLRPEATYVKVAGKAITELTDIPVDELLVFFENIQLSEHDTTIAKRLLLEIINRLRVMCDVGLSYLALSRIASTLSGGETQRINLTRTLGSNLTSSMYILDEPSVGLHPRDSARLVEVLKKLRDLGNTVIVVEHEEDIIKNADYLVDMGPLAGIHGGEVVFAGPYEKIYDEANDSLTAKYMSGRMSIPVPKVRRALRNRIVLRGAKQNNLQNFDVTFPLNTLTVVSGVSGSGKTTLVKQLLYPALKKRLEENSGAAPGYFDDLEGDVGVLSAVEIISQSPIGKSSRSNPVTYVKAYDGIRLLYSNQQLAKIRGYKPGQFSFNVEGGRCETCKGEGEQVVEMQFLADVRLECEDCRGKRFKQETLDIFYKGKNIYDVLDMSIEEALDFFKDQRDIYQPLKPLMDVGLGYVKLGQSSSTLSGGEAQRVKLASFLGKERSNEHIFFIFDEPTTGLHFHDIQKLLDALNALVEKGHTVLVVEHNMEVIKNADWLIDLGPEGGKAGGNLVYEGLPEGLLTCKGSYTAKYLREKL